MTETVLVADADFPYVFTPSLSEGVNHFPEPEVIGPISEKKDVDK